MLSDKGAVGWKQAEARGRLPWVFDFLPISFSHLVPICVIRLDSDIGLQALPVSMNRTTGPLSWSANVAGVGKLQGTLSF